MATPEPVKIEDQKSPIKTLKDSEGNPFAPATYASAVKYKDTGTVQGAIDTLKEHEYYTYTGLANPSQAASNLVIYCGDIIPDWFIVYNVEYTTANMSNTIYALTYFNENNSSVVCTGSTTPTITATYSDKQLSFTQPSSSATAFAAGVYEYLLIGKKVVS